MRATELSLRRFREESRMAEDFAQELEGDAPASAVAPSSWPPGMIQGAVEAGIFVDTPAGKSVSEALARVARRVAAWAEDEALGEKLLALLNDAKVMLDPPFMRAALSANAQHAG